LVALEWEKWVTAVLVANGGWFKADQDLTNLVIGRRDIPVHYMPGRFNVHLGIPDTIQGVGMVKPICAYNMASSVLAALGTKGAVSFAHWTWMTKPWTKPTVEGLRNQRDKLPARMMVIAQTGWYNEYGECREQRSSYDRPSVRCATGLLTNASSLHPWCPATGARFANRTGLAGMMKWPIREVTEFGSLQEKLARECIGKGIGGAGVYSCGLLREAHDETLPPILPPHSNELPLIRLA
jgi:hypothetical protein